MSSIRLGAFYENMTLSRQEFKKLIKNRLNRFSSFSFHRSHSTSFSICDYVITTKLGISLPSAIILALILRLISHFSQILVQRLHLLRSFETELLLFNLLFCLRARFKLFKCLTLFAPLKLIALKEWWYSSSSTFCFLHI